MCGGCYCWCAETVVVVGGVGVVLVIRVLVVSRCLFSSVVLAVLIVVSVWLCWLC